MLQKDPLQRELIISTTKAIAEGWLLPSIKNFINKYPEININIVAEDYLSNSLSNSADIFLRTIEDSDNLSKKWCTSYTHGLFASQTYLDEIGTPTSPKDLLEHRIIAYGEQEFSYFKEINWHIKGLNYGIPKLTPTLSINSTYAIYTAAIENMGVCSYTIEPNFRHKENLIRVLPEITGPTVKSYFCTRNGSGKLKQNNIDLFQSYLEQYLAKLGVNITHE